MSFPASGVLRSALVLALAIGLAGCTPLGVFATFTPRDPAIVRASSQAYGPLPRQRLDVYAPRQMTVARPVAIFFYGGGWEKGRKWDYGWVAQALAARGYVVVMPDYRLYPSVRFPEFLKDGAQAIRWAVDHAGAYGGDVSRIVLLGHSAGAYNAVMLGLDDRYLRAAGVEPSRIRGVVGLAGPYDFLPLRGHRAEIFGAAADPQETQPSQFISPASPPMLLATGAEDAVVDPSDTETLARRLGEQGAKVEVKVYPGVGHNELMAAISRPFRDRAEVLQDVTEFMAEVTD